MMEFLAMICVSSSKEVAEKAADVLVDQFLDELVRSDQVTIVMLMRVW